MRKIYDSVYPVFCTVKTVVCVKNSLIEEDVGVIKVKCTENLQSLALMPGGCTCTSNLFSCTRQLFNKIKLNKIHYHEGFQPFYQHVRTTIVSMVVCRGIKCLTISTHYIST